MASAACSWKRNGMLRGLRCIRMSCDQENTATQKRADRASELLLQHDKRIHELRASLQRCEEPHTRLLSSVKSYACISSLPCTTHLRHRNTSVLKTHCLKSSSDQLPSPKTSITESIVCRRRTGGLQREGREGEGGACSGDGGSRALHAAGQSTAECIAIPRVEVQILIVLACVATREAYEHLARRYSARSNTRIRTPSHVTCCAENNSDAPSIQHSTHSDLQQQRDDLCDLHPQAVLACSGQVFLSPPGLLNLSCAKLSRADVERCASDDDDSGEEEKGASVEAAERKVEEEKAKVNEMTQQVGF
eukprot:2119765-Rhodomonas_salina.1